MNRICVFIKEKAIGTVCAVLPHPLARLRIKRLGLAIISCIVSVATAIITRDAAALALIVVSVFFALTALKLSYDYANGSIIGYSLLCLSVTPKNGSFTVVFEDEELATYVLVHYSKKKEFFEDVKYEFYTHKNTPKTIIAFEQI